jgi:hypothetical protein
MNGIDKFLVYLSAAIVADFGVLTFTVRKRIPRPYMKLVLVAILVTAAGMIFARITYGKALPWWIFYGIPVIFTFVVPPLVLRMSLKELGFYIPLAILLAPAIHICFSFFFGWHDYMPLFYVPWISDLLK